MINQIFFYFFLFLKKKVIKSRVIGICDSTLCFWTKLSQGNFINP